MALDGLDEGMPARERLLPLEGVNNFRDMGGYRGAEGRRVRWGRLFRSGHLHTMTDGDRLKVEALGIGLVVDFRQDAERGREPSAWKGKGPRTETVTIVPGSADAFFAGAGQGEVSLDRTAAFIAFNYRDFALNQTAAYRAMFSHVLGAGDAAVLLHCAAGKDRTGFGSALLLSALGVGREDVVQDYLLTGRYLDADKEMAHVLAIVPQLMRPPLTRETIRPMFEVRRSYLESAFAAMEEEAGTVEAYLETCLGVGDAERRELRGRYLA